MLICNSPIYNVWRDVGVCVPFPVKQIKANNVIDNIIQNIHYKRDDEMTIYNDDDEQRKNGHNQTRRYV